MPQGNRQFGKDQDGIKASVLSLARLLARQAVADVMVAEHPGTNAPSSHVTTKEESDHG